MLTISQLFIYPIKSLGGFAVKAAKITDRGFEFDRRWMLVDENNRFMTQRQSPAMALLQVELADGFLTVRHKHTGSSITIPHDTGSEPIEVQVWNDQCKALPVNKDVDSWFSEQLSLSCRLVYMPDDTERLVDKAYAKNNEITSFSDAYPFLIIGQSSLDELNSRLDQQLPINRFRPNMVFAGGSPYQEDTMEEFVINGIHFFGVKPCARCTIITIEQSNGIAGKEPLKTLSEYRLKNNKVYFGQNLLHTGNGIVSTGDTITVLRTGRPVDFD